MARRLSGGQFVDTGDICLSDPGRGSIPQSALTVLLSLGLSGACLAPEVGCQCVWALTLLRSREWLMCAIKKIDAWSLNIDLTPITHSLILTLR